MGGPLPTASYYGGMRLLLLSMGGRRPYNYLVTGGISLGNPRDPFSMGGIVLSFCLAVPLRGEDGGCWWVVLTLRTATLASVTLLTIRFTQHMHRSCHAQVS